jgi:hypothetical protein
MQVTTENKKIRLKKKHTCFTKHNNLLYKDFFFGAVARRGK